MTDSYDKEVLIKDFNTRISRGDKIGIIGPNGCGKTTLVNILLKKIKGYSGEVELGSNLSITYFDQLREQLDEKKNVWENVFSFEDVIPPIEKRKSFAYATAVGLALRNIK